MERANPFIGKVGKFGKVEEERVECVCNKGRAKEVVAAMRKVTHTKK